MPSSGTKMTSRQPRSVASLIALLFMSLVYLSLANPPVAHAAELDFEGSTSLGEDHNWQRIAQANLEDDGLGFGELDELEEFYEEEGEDVIEKRATDQTAQDINDNNSPNTKNILGGQTAVWFYSNDLRTSPHAERGPGLPSDSEAEDDAQADDKHAELKKRGDLEERQSGTKVFVSINTCLQPLWNGTGTQTAAPPQLTLYVSTSSSNKSPGPDASDSDQDSVVLDQGFANISVTVTDGFYIAVHAPSVPTGFSGVWNYELAASIDAYYHAADMNDKNPFLYLVDTDIRSALLVTDNLTQAEPSDKVFQQWMNTSTPFIMFAANYNHTATMGMTNSFCGWSQVRQIEAQQSDPLGDGTGVQMGMITRGLGNKPKEQFYVTNLNSSSFYRGVLAMEGNSTKSGAGVVGGGGKVWQPVSWTTKADGNCALLFNLTFCNEVAYAVPSNPSKYNITQMQTLFDNYTSTYYQNFNYSLQQIPCNTDSSSQYSLAKGCTDCADAYKTWLCAVSIPRCQDWTNTEDFLQPRNVGQSFINGTSLPDDFLNSKYIPMDKAPTLAGSPRDQQTYISSFATNSSRNPGIIDDLIQPGPYKELLPCEDLCWGLVQNCPASMGFACPRAGKGLEAGYAPRSGNATLQCSYLGAVYTTNSASGMAAGVWKAVGVAVLAAALVLR